jgi:hypothetical protein
MRGYAWCVWLCVSCGFQPATLTTNEVDASGQGGSNVGSAGSGSGSGSNSGGCVNGMRACKGTAQSGVCVGGVVQVDRDCPPTSTCSNGYCQPPPGATACSDDATCSGAVCDPYVIGGTVISGFCTPPGPGTRGADASCNVDSDCATGLCVQQQCYGECTTGVTQCPHNQDCDTFSCHSEPLTLEGVPTNVSTCRASGC